MNLSFLTPQVFNLLVIATIIVGLALAAVRLYDDLTRPLPPGPDDDTQPHKPVDEHTQEEEK